MCTGGGRPKRGKMMCLVLFLAKPGVFLLGEKVVQIDVLHSCYCAFQPLRYDVMELCPWENKDNLLQGFLVKASSSLQISMM